MEPDAEDFSEDFWAALNARLEERRRQDRSRQDRSRQDRSRQDRPRPYGLNLSGWYARMIAAERENAFLAAWDARQLASPESENPEPPTHRGAAPWGMGNNVEPPRAVAHPASEHNLNDSEPAVVIRGDSGSVGTMSATGQTRSEPLIQVCARAMRELRAARRQRMASQTRHQSDTEKSQGHGDRNPESAHAIHPPETEEARHRAGLKRRWEEVAERGD